MGDLRRPSCPGSEADSEARAVVLSGQAAVLLAFGLTVLLLVMAGMVQFWLFPVDEMVVTSYQHLFIQPESLRPERRERVLFLLFVCLLLPVAWWSAKKSTAWSRPAASETSRPSDGLFKRAWTVGIVTLVCATFYPFIDSAFIDWIWPKTHFDSWFWLISIIASTGIFLFAKRHQSGPGSHTLRQGHHPVGRAFALSSTLLLSTIVLDHFANLHWTTALSELQALLSLIAVLIFIAGIYIDSLRRPDHQLTALLHRHDRWMIPVLLCLAISSIAIIEGRRVQGLPFVVTDRSKWTSHFEAVFYSMSQVMGGRSLLVDLPSQYGFFSELLAPWFRLIGLSVLNFSITMFGLQLVAQTCLLIVCYRSLRTPRLFMLASFSLLALTTSAWHSISQNHIDPYFQYWPLRLFFPALACLVFWRMLSRDFAVLWQMAYALTCGLAMIWNLDSGVPVYGALLAFVVYRWIYASVGQRRAWVFRGLLLTLVASALLVLFFWILDARGGYRIHLEDAFKYQNLFYRLGFYMLPLPLTPSPWMVVLGYYVFGVVYAMLMRARGHGSQHADMVYFLSILGIGLFSYYQGRSHELNLLVVMWPAALVGFMLADRNLRLIRARLLGTLHAWLALPVTAFGALCLWVLVLGPSSLLPKLPAHLQVAFGGSSTPVMKNIEFIRAKAAGQKSAVIIAPHQAIYFAEAGLVSGVQGPGLAEIALVEDWQKLRDRIASGELPHLFVQENLRNDPYTEFRVALALYVRDGESEGGLVHWVPKPSGSESSPKSP